MRCGPFGKSTGIVRMAPAVVEDAPDVLEKNIVVNSFREASAFIGALAFFLHLHSRQECNILLIGE